MNKNKNWLKKLKETPGFLEPCTYKKGKCESPIEGLKEGDLFWTINTGEGRWYDCKEQDIAEIISTLAIITSRQKEIEKTLLEVAKVVKILAEKEIKES